MLQQKLDLERKLLNEKMERERAELGTARESKKYIKLGR